jgi:voltage-gated potassium channel Kch
MYSKATCPSARAINPNPDRVELDTNAAVGAGDPVVIVVPDTVTSARVVAVHAYSPSMPVTALVSSTYVPVTPDN